jgi:beta-N-acetylhexosaminidase
MAYIQRILFRDLGYNVGMKNLFIIIALLFGSAYAKTLDQKIANMFIVGFYGTKVSKNTKIIQDICRRGLGGVLLFERHPTRHSKAKNISTPSQLKRLTQALGSGCAHKPLIAVDQEGGKVQRLRAKDGFYGRYPKASVLGAGTMDVAKRSYTKMAQELHRVGINYNLAPVADMAVNKKNRVIYRLGRSYGSRGDRVAMFDKIFINAMHRQKILTSLKHFPGHGSSLGDTHKGFVDVSKTWSNKELLPFKQVIDSGKADSIMVAHVFNQHIDSRYPASLSYKTIHGLLRGKLGYRGVVITDDLQMYAISKHYSLKNTIKLAINAGVDILLFGNQLDPKHEVTIEKLVSITKSLLSKGEIKTASIDRANRRIDTMRAKIGLGH